MTVTFPLGDPVAPSQPVLPIGSLVYLASYLIKMKLHAETTGSDTPNLYSADLEIMGDQGDMQIDPLLGPRGYPGKHTFPLRRQSLPVVNTQADIEALAPTLTDTPKDIGKYWNLAELDQWDNITGLQSWIWWGTGWRVLMIGSYGQPGAVPQITPEINQIPPQAQPTYPDKSSSIDTSGSTLEPTWVFNLPLPGGLPGTITELYDFPDVDTTGWETLPVNSLMGATNEYTESGLLIWRPRTISNMMPGAFSMPENAFSSYSGVSQRAAIGSYAIPPQPWPWTPVVWGQLGGPVPSALGLLNAIQNIIVSALDGTFNLIINGTPTAAIPYNASPTTIESAIQAVIGAGNAAVTAGEQDFSHVVEFVGSLAGTAVSTMTADISGLLGAGASVLINPAQIGGVVGTTVQHMLTGEPLMIGCQVLLGDPVNGQLIARGLGNFLGKIAVMPHYSRSDGGGRTSDSITPTNRRALVPANHTNPAQGTVYVSLWNDGAHGAYDFQPQNAQLFMMVVPMLGEPSS
jgi:hypothetical protein